MTELTVALVIMESQQLMKTNIEGGSGPRNGKPYDGATQLSAIAGDEGGNSVGTGAMEGAKESEILEKIQEKLPRYLEVMSWKNFRNEKKKIRQKKVMKNTELV
ncbi:hypothetical protein Pyn_08384 [Prunus yedoensis var. nudiflora]|uniref:Uncharacterized protein n=1 Tax=Prunus yedoensis var. nudiflora TaxID=2094558 RepID=A0A314YCN9_PRUYE|nr:hypothetical protein Pyn_08384 [Prunus yedoensis var. nudiflora]